MENAQVYTVKDIQDILHISKNTAYKLLADPPFAVVKFGKTIRIPKEGFDSWASGNPISTE